MKAKAQTISLRVTAVILLAAGLALWLNGRRPPEVQPTTFALRGDRIDAPIPVRLTNTPPTLASKLTPAIGGAAATPSPSAAPDPRTGQAPHAVDAGDKDVDLVSVGFELLASFSYSADDPAEKIPAPIRALNGKRVALKGFMLPLKIENGLVTEMLLMRDQSMCCYGKIPRLNEWVSVKMSGKGAKAIMDQPVTMCGWLKVGEVRQNGVTTGLYTMSGESLAGPFDL